MDWKFVLFESNKKMSLLRLRQVIQFIIFCASPHFLCGRCRRMYLRIMPSVVKLDSLWTLSQYCRIIKILLLFIQWYQSSLNISVCGSVGENCLFTMGTTKMVGIFSHTHTHTQLFPSISVPMQANDPHQKSLLDKRTKSRLYVISHVLYSYHFLSQICEIGSYERHGYVPR